MTQYNIKPLDLSNLKTYPLAERKSKVSVNDLAKPVDAGSSIHDFFECLPNILAVRTLKKIAIAIYQARQSKRAVICGLGGHVIKCGLAPILIDLMKCGYITAFALNGSGAIHDFEIALSGSTSEDVDASLLSGTFGGAEETGHIINQTLLYAQKHNLGAGEAIGHKLIEMNPSFASSSLLCSAYDAKVPVTVHVAIGTDITHIHPTADGSAIGAASYRDFQLFCSLVQYMDNGGVYLNLGSAVILPEVFLKAVTVIRNLGYPLRKITTVNFDFMQHYRPTTNVITRPVAEESGQGFAITGHHELMIPLLAAAIKNLR